MEGRSRIEPGLAYRRGEDSLGRNSVGALPHAADQDESIRITVDVRPVDGQVIGERARALTNGDCEHPLNEENRPKWLVGVGRLERPTSAV